MDTNVLMELHQLQIHEMKSEVMENVSILSLIIVMSALHHPLDVTLTVMLLMDTTVLEVPPQFQTLDLKSEEMEKKLAMKLEMMAI